MNFRHALALTLVVALVTSTALRAQDDAAEAPRARTASGPVEGFRSDDNLLDLFLGVPYAAPPVGELRWRAPQAHADWSEVLATKAFGPAALQHNVYGDMRYRSDGFSEDCLYLNVWTPVARADSGAGLPVLVYFYGGGFVAGDGSEPRYDGAAMARQGIVAVTVNYRLNVFGFFAHPELSAESGYGASGNYGLLDQAFALAWVRDNVAAFGGDPARVTIAGESAGSVSVSAQLVSPLARELVAGAIGESGAGIPPTLSPVPLDSAEAAGVALAKTLGAGSLQALRELPADTLYARYRGGGLPRLPSVLDGHFYPLPTEAVYERGGAANVPLLVGWTSAETGERSFLGDATPTSANFETLVRERFPGESADSLLRVYPHADEQEVRGSASQLASDIFIDYSTWRWWDLHRRFTSAPVYRYRFDRVRPPLLTEVAENSSGGATLPKPPIGAPHASEIPYVLGNLELADERAYDEDDLRVARTSLAYFANFVRTGDPNGPNLPHWPASPRSGEVSEVMRLDVEASAVEVSDERLPVLGRAITRP